jgi:cholesterol oxidase
MNDLQNTTNPSTKVRKYAKMTTQEEMKGYIKAGALDFQTGYAQGRSENDYIVVHFNLTAENLERFIKEPEHEAKLEGYITCTNYWGKATVIEGKLNLFIDTVNPAMKKLIYRLFFNDEQGNPLTFYGLKELTDYPFTTVLRDTQLLYVKILKGWVQPGQEDAAPVYAKGLLFLYFKNFIRFNIFHLRFKGPGSWKWMFRFYCWFFGNLRYIRRFKKKGRSSGG